MEINDRTGFSLTSTNGLAVPLGDSQPVLPPTNCCYDRGEQYHCGTQQGCEKWAGDKTVGQQWILGKDPVYQFNKLNHQIY
jgi:hypothetical protein